MSVTSGNCIFHEYESSCYVIIVFTESRVEGNGFHLPNLPGIRRGPLEPQPKIFYKSRSRGPKIHNPVLEEYSIQDDASLISCFEDYSKTLIVFPENANS
jgi:hypothetical protein